MGSETGVEVILVEHDKVSSMFNELNKDSKFNLNETLEESLKRKRKFVLENTYICIIL